MSTLNHRQEAFCQEYIKDFNITQAAIRAGYKEKNAGASGHEIFKKPEIGARIAQLMEARTKRTEIDADWVLNQAVKLHNRCMQGEPVLDREGNETGEWRFEHAGASKSLELIGKHVNVQAFNDRQTSEITHKVEESLAARLTGGSKR